MIWLVIFLMVCSFGLGVGWNIIWTNMKALDEMVARHRREEKEFVEKFKQGVDNIIKQQPADLSNLKDNIKKKH